MPKHRRLIVAAVFLACCASALLEAQEPKTAAAGAITPITGNLYGLSAGGQHTIFLVTADGVVLVDPLARATVEWLTTELDQRFPKQPVRYVLATHFELPRVEAISSFYQTADVVGHRAFNGRLSSSRRASPDTHRFVRQVETEFSGRWTVTLGADIIDMIHVESERVPDLSIVYFRNERTVFSPYAVGTAVPFSFSGQRPSDVFNWLHTVSALDFDTVLFGDGQRATRTQITQLAEYLDAMRAEVAAEYERGYSLDEVQARVTLPSHERNPHYAGRQTQVASIYRTLRLLRVEANGAGLAAMTPRDSSDYCEGYEICSSGGLLPAGTVGLAFWLNRRIAMSGEVTLGAQSWSTRLSPLYAEEVALRQSRSAVLFHYAPRMTGPRTYVIVAGASFTVGDIKGIDRVEGRLLPGGGRHVIDNRSVRAGVTIGADVTQTVSRRVRLFVPVRVTLFRGDVSQHWAGEYDIQIGAGLRFGVFRRVS